MKTMRIGAALASLVLIMCCAAPAAATPAVGDQVGNLRFPAPISQEDANYLGLSQPQEFSLKDVNAPYVLVEIMRTTCPHCMEQAPALNELYRLVQNSDLRNKIKFIAIGESNHAPALRSFKAGYKVPFPLLPDPDWTFGDGFHIAGTPTTVVLDKSGRIIMVEEGVFPSASQFFRKLQARLK